jgi:hypothetical protein
MTGFQILLQRGLLSKGTIVGIQHPTRNRVYNRFLVDSINLEQDELVFSSVCLTTHAAVSIKSHQISEIDGMTVDRFFQQVDLHTDGTPINNGKKRGRKAKVR